MTEQTVGRRRQGVSDKTSVFGRSRGEMLSQFSTTRGRISERYQRDSTLKQSQSSELTPDG